MCDARVFLRQDLDKIFYKVVYHHIIYMCDFFVEFRRLFFPWFARVFTKVVVSTRYVCKLVAPVNIYDDFINLKGKPAVVLVVSLLLCQ